MAGTLSFEANKEMKRNNVKFHDSENAEFKEYIIISELSRDDSSVCELCEKGGKRFVLKRYFHKLTEKMSEILKKIIQMHSTYLAEIIEYGELNECAFEIQRYYEGCSLNSISDISQINIGTVVYELNKALADLHNANIVHNDIKPENIIVYDGHCILTDYGNTTAGAGMITSFTPEYAAPEVISNGFVSTSSDYFSLGVTIYEIVTGSNPFKSVSNYENMNIKNKENWIVKDAIGEEIFELISKLCTASSETRWQYSETSNWYEKYEGLLAAKPLALHRFSDEIGSIAWNGKTYKRHNLSEFVSDLGKNWNNAIDFLFSGMHDREIRLYSPEIASAIDSKSVLYTDELKGQSLLNYLAQIDENLCDYVLLDVLVNCGIEFTGVYWRGFKGATIGDLALEMLNDCFTQYFSSDYGLPKRISRTSFAGSALSYGILSKYYLYLSDNFSETENTYKMIQDYEKSFSSSGAETAAEAAFALCYKLSGSKEFPLLNMRNVNSITSLHSEVINALNSNSKSDIMQLIAKCSLDSGFNASFRIWISEIAPRTD